MKKQTKKNVEDVLELTPLQEGMLFHYLKNPRNSLYCEQLCLELGGRVHRERFDRAWNLVVSANDLLRTYFRWEKINQPVQVVLKEHRVDAGFRDLSDITAPGVLANETDKIIREERQKPFNLGEVPFRLLLIKTGAERHHLIISNHHILFDGWSTGIILEEFFHTYDRLAGSEQAPIFPPKPSFKEFIKWRRQQDKDGQQAFWQKYLEGFETRTELPVKRNRLIHGESETANGKANVTPGNDFKDKLADFVKGQQVTMAAFFFCAWGILLQRYCDSDDVVFGTTVSGRSVPIKGIGEMVGLFINTIPLRLKKGTGANGKTDTVETLLQNVNRALTERRFYENTPLADINGYSQLGNVEELFDSLVVVENYPLDSRLMSANGELSINSYSIEESTNYDISVSITTAGSVGIDLIYHTDVCDKETVERLGDHLKRIMEGMMVTPGAAVHQLQMIGEEERRTILVQFNDTGSPFPEDITLSSLFDTQAGKSPDNAALVGKRRGGNEIERLTYRQLGESANALARLLVNKGVLPGELVGLLAERSLEMIIGMLAILKAGGAYVPLNPNAPASRNSFILADCNVKLLLTANDSPLQFAEGLEVIRLEGAMNCAPTIPVSPLPGSPDQLAYVIYTSGSTGMPKGVPITHANLCPLLHWGYRYIGLDTSDRSAQNLSYYFDWSAWEIFIALTSGTELYTIPEDLLRDAESYVDYINENRITVLHITPTHFRSLVHRGKKFTSMKHLAIGAERLTYDQAQQALQLVDPGCRVYNMYGPTEATIMSAVLDIDPGKMPYYKELSSVPIGNTLGNNELYILDRHFNPCPVYVTGELYIGGGGVAGGYLNNPELTAGKFITLNRSFGSNRTYKTGDLCRWLPGGNIEFLGRADHQVKIRGFRIEPGEIESRLLEHEGVKETVVLARERENGETYLCAYVVPEESSEVVADSLRKYLSGRLPDYMVPTFFTVLENLPLTPNNKIDRKNLPEPELAVSRGITLPRNAVEKSLSAIWGKVLGMDTSAIGIDDDFFHLGGHSLNAVALAGRIHKAFDREIPLPQIFENPTIRLLAEAIDGAESKCHSAIEPVEEREFYAVSSVQKRLYIMQQMETGSTVYNIYGIMELSGMVDREKFRTIFEKLITRHESFRTSFHIVEGVPVQRVHSMENIEFQITTLQVGALHHKSHIPAIIERFIAPYDLARAPLLRVGIVEMEDNPSLLVVDMHHIISDGKSLGILIRDFMTLYEGQTLPGLRIQYKDYTAWQQQESVRALLKQQEAFWLNRFPGEIPVLTLPCDYSRPAVQEFAGKELRFQLEEKHTQRLIALASQEKATLFMVLLSLYNILLTKLSGQEDIVVGTPVAGRRHIDLQQTVGMFVNTLALRNEPAVDKTAVEFLNNVKEKTVAAFDCQDYHYEDLVEKVADKRDAGRNPLFDTMISVQSMDIPEIEVAGLSMKTHRNQRTISKFDLTLECVEKGGKLHCTFEYSTRLFKEDTILRFAGYFERLVATVTENPIKKILEIDIIPAEEKENLLIHFNDTYTDYPRDKTIHELFEKEAAAEPGRMAVVYREAAIGAAHLSYGELDRRAGYLALMLQTKGVGPETIVALKVERSLEMVMGILGILKAGGAYLPIDPGYPEERIRFMLKDSNATLMLTKDDISPVRPATRNPQPATGKISSTDLAYIIYTSGSTGKPKGTMISHSNVVRVVKETNYIEIIPEDRILQLSNYAFDGSVFDIYGALLNGAKLVMAAADEVSSTVKLGGLIIREGVTVFFVTTALFNTLVDLETGCLGSMRKVLFGGETVSVPHTRKALDFMGSNRILHMYGPTETTVYATYYPINTIPEGMATIPIGKPIANTTVYLLDKWLHPVPIMVSGEIYIGGNGVCRGYLNNPELTAARFVDLNWPHGSSRTYKTGDLARRLPDGSIEFMGRIDHQVKIRGFRVEPGEIENSLATHPGIHEVVVLVKVKPDGDKYLCAYFIAAGAEENSVPKPAELKEFLAPVLPNFMIPSYFVRMEKIPLNKNGKVDRSAFPEPAVTAETAYAPPRNWLEKKMVDVWSDVLTLPPSSISIDDHFFETGGHSLKAVQLISKIHKALDINIPLENIFNNPTIRELAASIKDTVKDTHIPIMPVEEKEYYKVSSAQKRLFVLHQMAPRGTGYNVPIILEPADRIDKNRLEHIFAKLIKQHESLRTSFHLLNDEPVQRVHQDVEPDIRRRRAEEREIPGLIQPFDLSRAPLMRVIYIENESDRPLLLVDMHHIIADGSSLAIFVKDFSALYNGKDLPDPGIQYKDFSQWRNSEEQAAVIEGQKTFWLKEFTGEIPALHLPTDFPRPQVQDFVGNAISIEIGKDETRGMIQCARAADATLFMVLLGAVHVWLYKLSGQEDIVIGSPIASRRHADLDQVMGMFVNTLPLRNVIDSKAGFDIFLKSLRDKTLCAYENQDYPFEELVETLEVQRDPGRNPLFDVMFSLQSGVEEAGETSIKTYSIESNSAKFDIVLTALETGENIIIMLGYSTRLFKKETIERFVTYFKAVLSGIAADPAIPPAQLQILSPEEKEQVLMEFNDTGKRYPEDKTIHQLFGEQVERTPDSTALVFKHQYLSYRQLDQTANRLTRVLREKGAGPETIVAIKVERSVEMIIGILGILKAGCAYLPLNPTAPTARNSFMLKDCNVGLLLTANGRSPEPAEGLEIAHLEGAINCAPTKPFHPNNLAYVIYTSGSTGTPKGVPVTHANFSQLIHWGYRHLGIGSNDRTFRNLSYYFDWSVWEIFITLTTGASLYMVPGELLLDPAASVAFMNTHDMTVLHVTPTQYQYIAGVDANALSLRYLFLGAEKLTCSLVKQSFSSVHEDCRVFNMYGPTEATIISAVLEIYRDSTSQYLHLTSVPIGTPTGNTGLYILDKDMNLCPVNIPGELYISGGGLSRGYLNNPGLTAERFGNLNRSYGSYRTYKTGDLARWLSNGNIEFLGRIDHQVKIRGFRIELGEIENQLLKCDEVNEAVVIVRTDNSGDRYLAAYITESEPPGIDELKSRLSKYLPQYMIPADIVLLDKIPLTPGGKMDREKLPEPRSTRDNREVITPRDPLEKKLARIWQEVLWGKKAEEPKTSIGIDHNFFHLGGHSLNATVVISRIHKEFGVQLPLSSFFSHQTIRVQANFIRELRETAYTRIPRAEKKEYYPLSSAQMRLYIMQEMVPGSTGYNMPSIMTLTGELEGNKLDVTFRTLIKRHDSLRTSFEIAANEPVQRIHRRIDFNIEYFDTFQSFVRPFDLAKAPLIRVGLAEIEAKKHLLMVDMHHIISDGISLKILIEEFMALYNREELPVLRLQYKDYAVWQNNRLQDESIKQQEAFWLKEFEGDIPVLELPYDFTRPRIQTFDGDTFSFRLDSKETGRLRMLAREEDVTLFMALLAIYNIFLAKISSRETIIVGTPTAGRSHGDLQQIIGMFVNTLALKNEPSGEKAFGKFLTEVRGKTLAAFENQDYQYEELVEKLDIPRDAGRNPLFDTMLALQNRGNIPELEIPGLTLTPGAPDLGIARFDLLLHCTETGDGMSCNFEYATRVFKPETIEKFAGYFQSVVSSVINRPGARIKDIAIISAREKEEILNRFNRFEELYPQDKTIHGLFAEQVERTPDNIALVEGRELHLSFRQLGEISGALAGHLAARGAVAGDIAGILTEPSVEMVTCIIGILKAGCAYLPLNPKAPTARNRFMLKDCNVKLLLTANDLPLQLAEGLEVIRVEGAMNCAPTTPVSPLHGSPDQLAYVIYTSGSTGMPKGVPITHGNFSQLIHWGYHHLGIGPNDRTIRNLSYYFDWSVWEIFITLTTGARLVIVPREFLLDPQESVAFMATHDITVLHVTPTQYQNIAGTGAKVLSLRYLFLGAEKLTHHLAKQSFSSVHKDCRVFNMYGPTEATIISAVLEIYRDSLDRYRQLASIPIGKPTGNTGLYILDNYMNLCPVNIRGELYISGGGLSRGYLNNPELTEERFGNLLNRSYGSYRTYKTGDLARWLPDGNIEFLGRIDHQVKIRGFRIELGEIENRLLQHGKIDEAVVLAKQTANGEYQLHAYIVPAVELTVPGLKEFLAVELPEYMIPAHIARVDKIPVNPNGKVDRNALEALSGEIDTGVEYVAPRNNFEEAIAEIWREELNLERIGIHDNFFDLGGNSLNSVKISSRMREITGKAISVVTIFTYPTIHLLSQYSGEEEINNTLSDEIIEESVETMEDALLMMMGEDDE